MPIYAVMLRSTPVVLLAVTASALLSLLAAVELGRIWGLVCVLALSSALAVGAKRLASSRPAPRVASRSAPRE